MSLKQISIVIPTLNEENCIDKLLSHLKKNSYDYKNLEIIVVDGGSEDGTKTKVASQEDVTLLFSEKGRSTQMNYGSRYATAPILYFLHADTLPPMHFDKFILNAVETGHESGCFRIKFDHAHWWLWLASFLTRLPWKICRGGDQSLFVTKSLFEKIGRFDDSYAIFEDMDIIRKLYKNSNFKIIPKQVLTSSRRYHQNGIATLQYHFYILYLKRFFGANPKDLELYYKKNIR